VGASDDERKYGNWLAKRLLPGRRPVHLVNSHHTTVLGRRTVASLQAIGEPVDLAVLAIPASGFAAAVDDALHAGVKAVVGITAGLGELGGEHLLAQQALASRMRAAGTMLLGPNCLGLLDHTTGLNACIDDFPTGDIALISQSGNIALEIGRTMAACGLGLSRFVSMGNQADLDLVDLLRSCADHPGTRAIAIYCEGFGDGREFALAAHAAIQAGTPVVLLGVGASAAAARGAASHTGAMTSPAKVVGAACADAGIELVSSPTEMVDVLQGLRHRRPYLQPRVVVLADGGGHGAVASDLLESRGLHVNPLSEPLRDLLAAQLPARASVANPVDVAGAGEADLSTFAKVSELLMDADEVDAVLLAGYFGSYRGYGEELAAEEIAVADVIAVDVAARRFPYVAHLVEADSPAAARLRRGGVAVYSDAAVTADVLARMMRPSQAREQIPPRPIPAAPVAEKGYWASRRLLADAGVRFPEAAEVRTRDGLLRAAERIAFPLVCKALGTEHKSDAGGVVVGIADLESLLAAWTDLQQRLRPECCSVEESVELSSAVELIVGARTDPAFGSVIMVGLGGVLAELLDDTVCALGPVSAQEAGHMLARLRGARLLDGYRGRPPVDVAAAAELISVFSRVAAEHPEIAEMECNPVAVTPTGALALDSRLVLVHD
jgi:acyl-CoA synthetase (NDP forming)